MRKAFGYVNELLKGLAGRLTPSGCALRVPELCEGGFPASAWRKCVVNRRCTSLPQATYATRQP